MHRQMTESLTSDLDDLVSGATTMSWQNLNRVSAPPGVSIDDAIIMAIRKRPLIAQGEMIRKLAGEVAYARLVEQGRLLTLLLRTGFKEPNVSAFDPAKVAVDDAISNLQVELNQLDMEIKTRQAIAKNTIQRILGNEEKLVQETRSIRRGNSSGTNQLGQP